MEYNCAIHDTVEIGTENDYLVCFECGHVYKTEQELIDEDYVFRAELYAKYPDTSITVSPATDADEITCCPLCFHDF